MSYLSIISRTSLDYSSEKILMKIQSPDRLSFLLRKKRIQNSAKRRTPPRNPTTCKFTQPTARAHSFANFVKEKCEILAIWLYKELGQNAFKIPCIRSRLSSSFRIRRGSFISCMAEHLLCISIEPERRRTHTG